jgi:UDP-GlcNAc:undecaprenyl-phosphate GlcNAc-1-phosphate transferase
MFDDPIIKSKILEIWTSLIDKIYIPGSLEKYISFLPILIIGFVLTFVLTPIIGSIAKKNNVVYVPNVKRKGKDFDNPDKAMHKGIIPALGGLGVMIPVLLVILVFFKIDSITLPLLIALGILTIGGVLDDIFNLPAKVQMGIQVLAALVICTSILDFESFTVLGTTIPMNLIKIQPVIGKFAFSLTFPGDLFLLAWLVFCINSFKWVGGSPGLIEGNALIITSLIFIISIRHQVLFSSTVSSLLVGSLLAFLIFAYPPPLIMSGSPGKSVYGLLICTLSLISQTKFATTLILLLLPTLDATYVLIRRYIEYRPKNPLELMKISDTTHFHHRLLKMDISPQKVFWIELGLTLLIGSLAVVATGALRYFCLIWGVIFIITIILFLKLKSAQQENSKKHKEESSESKYSY